MAYRKREIVVLMDRSLGSILDAEFMLGHVQVLSCATDLPVIPVLHPSAEETAFRLHCDSRAPVGRTDGTDPVRGWKWSQCIERRLPVQPLRTRRSRRQVRST